MDRILKWYIAVRDKMAGATAVEYGLIVALIAIVIIIAVALLGTNLRTLFYNIANELADLPSS